MKKRIIASILPAFLWFTSYSQLPPDSALLGSWQLVGHEMKSRFSSASTLQILSFFGDGVYQQFASSSELDTALENSSGDWQLEKKRGNLVLTLTRKIPPSFQSLSKPMVKGVEQLSDSLLVLSGYEDTLLIMSHYCRIEDVPRIRELYQAPAHTISERNQSPYGLYLFHCAGTRKPVRIKPERRLELAIHPHTVNTIFYTSREVKLYGQLLSVNDSMITLKLDSENTSVQYPNNTRSTVINSYYNSTDEERRELLMVDIQSLYYSSPTRYALSNTGGIIITVSAFTLLMVAPLVSIQYKEGGFNADRYFLWAGAGLTGLAIGIPLTIFSSTKAYNLSNYHNNTPCRNCWQLVKMPLPQ